MRIADGNRRAFVPLTADDGVREQAIDCLRGGSHVNGQAQCVHPYTRKYVYIYIYACVCVKLQLIKVEFLVKGWIMSKKQVAPFDSPIKIKITSLS